MAARKRGVEAMKANAKNPERPKTAPEGKDGIIPKEILGTIDKAMQDVADRMDNKDDAKEWLETTAKFKNEIYDKFKDSKNALEEIAKFIADEDKIFDLQMEITEKETAKEIAKEEAETEYQKAVEKATEEAKSKAEIVDVTDDLELVEEPVAKVVKKKATVKKKTKAKTKKKAKAKSKTKAKVNRLKGDELTLAKMVGIPHNQESLSGIKEKYDLVAEQIQSQHGFDWNDFTTQETGAMAFVKSLYGGNKAKKEQMMQHIMDAYDDEIRGSATTEATERRSKDEAAHLEKMQDAEDKFTAEVSERAPISTEQNHNRYNNALAETGRALNMTGEQVENMEQDFDSVADMLDFTWSDFTAMDNSLLGFGKKLLGINKRKKEKMFNKFMDVYRTTGANDHKAKGKDYLERKGQDLA